MLGFGRAAVPRRAVLAAGVTPKLWEMADMVKVLEDWEASQAAV